MSEKSINKFRKIIVEPSSKHTDILVITTEDKNSSTTWRASSVKIYAEEKDWLIEQLQKI